MRVAQKRNEPRITLVIFLRRIRRVREISKNTKKVKREKKNLEKHARTHARTQ
jgi:hypothetical protein